MKRDEEARNLEAAYDTLIETVKWERTRSLQKAEALARQFGEDRAVEWLRAQVEYILDQASR
jgi:hypothetical protein